jgi:hypothetical protein
MSATTMMSPIDMTVSYPVENEANPSAVAAVGVRPRLPRVRAQATRGTPALPRAPHHATAAHALFENRTRRCHTLRATWTTRT